MNISGIYQAILMIIILLKFTTMGYGQSNISIETNGTFENPTFTPSGETGLAKFTWPGDDAGWFFEFLTQTSEIVIQPGDVQSKAISIGSLEFYRGLPIGWFDGPKSNTIDLDLSLKMDFGNSSEPITTTFSSQSDTPNPFQLTSSYELPNNPRLNYVQLEPLSAEKPVASYFTGPSGGLYRMDILGFGNVQGQGYGSEPITLPKENPSSELEIFQKITHELLGSMFSEPEPPVTADIMAQVTRVDPKYIIGLTHGWQPSGSFSEDGSYLPEVEQAILARLGDEIENRKLAAGDVHVINNNWQGAFGGGRSRSSYAHSYAASINAGKNFADELKTFTSKVKSEYESSGQSNNKYEPSLHLIGHSLGTIATAQTVSKLRNTDISVEQVTLLDTPYAASYPIASTLTEFSRVKQEIASQVHGLLFWEWMPRGSVEYVENFYAEERLTFFDFPFGQPIAGANPRVGGSYVGYELENASHNDVHSVYYSNIVEGNGVVPWATPAMGIPGNYKTWNPGNYKKEILDRVYQLSDGRAYSIHRSAGVVFLSRSPTLDEWQIELGEVQRVADGVQLISHSPVILSAEANLSVLMALGFTYDIIGDPEGVLTMSIEDMVVWSSNELSGAAFIDLGSSFDVTRIEWRYDSSISGSLVELSALSTYTIEAIPEPDGEILFVISAMLCVLSRYLPCRKNTISNTVAD